MYRNEFLKSIFATILAFFGVKAVKKIAPRRSMTVSEVLASVRRSINDNYSEAHDHPLGYLNNSHKNTIITPEAYAKEALAIVQTTPAYQKLYHSNGTIRIRQRSDL